LELGEDVLDAPNHPGRGFFSWSVKTSSIPSDEIPAPDGEEYLAMSLYFAAGRRGNGTSIYYYRAKAEPVQLVVSKAEAAQSEPLPTGPGCLANALSLFKQKAAAFRCRFAYPDIHLSFVFDSSKSNSYYLLVRIG
jgi:oligosaccharide reducing-end xylanase